MDGGEIYTENGSTTISGTLTLTNNAANTGPGTGIITNLSSTTLIVNSVIQGPGGLTKRGSGTTQIAAASTYTGPTSVGGGTLLITSSGSITTTPTVSVSSGATLDVTAIAPWNLASGQTLQGSGIVNGDVTVPAGSTIAAGTSSAIGTLSDTGNVILSGTNTMKVSRVSGATNDVLAVTNTITFGGVLNITSLGGTYQGGDTFTLFKAAGGLSGTFSATNLPSLSAGLAWVTTNLANGVLSVVATVNPNPTNITASISGNVLTLSWPADHTGWYLQVQTNSLSQGLGTNWTDVPNSSTVNSVNINMNPANGTVFYRMSLNP
jgi:autotransporter-associated beta strand protein